MGGLMSYFKGLFGNREIHETVQQTSPNFLGVERPVRVETELA